MTDIEDKALALLNEVRKGANPESEVTFVCRDLYDHEALCRAIEQHEAFRQEVSDALLRYFAPSHVPHGLKGFIIPAPKPDPLVEVLEAMKDGRAGPTTESYAKCLRAALDARGLEIREKKHD